MVRTDEFDIAVVYASKVEKARTPEEALTTIATIGEEDISFGTPVEVVRLYAYMLWLKRHGYDDWVKYLKGRLIAMELILAGSIDIAEKVTNELDKRKPKDWIDPWPYIRRKM